MITEQERRDREITSIPYEQLTEEERREAALAEARLAEGNYGESGSQMPPVLAPENLPKAPPTTITEEEEIKPTTLTQVFPRATPQQLAEAGIAPSRGEQGQREYQIQKQVESLPGGKDNPQFREFIEQGYSSDVALELMRSEEAYKKALEAYAQRPNMGKVETTNIPIISSMGTVTIDVAKRYPDLRIGEKFAILTTGGYIPISEDLYKQGVSETNTRTKDLIEKGILPKGSLYLSEKDGEITYIPDARSATRAEIGKYGSSDVYNALLEAALRGQSVMEAREKAKISRGMGIGPVPEGAIYTPIPEKLTPLQELIVRSANSYFKARGLNVNDKSPQLTPAVMRDIVTEAVSLGKATTTTFNKDDIGRLYDEQSKQIKMMGFLPGESRNEFIEKVSKEQDKANTQYIKDYGANFIPIAGTIYTWDRSSTAGKAINVALDIMFINAVARGTAALVRSGVSAPRAIGTIALQEVAAPFEAVLHPIRTAKQLGKQVYYMTEDVIDPSKIPLESLEVRSHTIRVNPEQLDITPRQAMQLRDDLTRLAEKAELPRAKVGDTVATLNTAALNKLSPVGVHASPDVTPFLNGATVGVGKTGDLYISPNVHTRFAMSTSTGLVPENGIKGALLIRDERVLNALESSGKLYKGKAEIESILKEGIELSPPSQALFTRDMAGEKLTLLVIGKPYTAAEVAQLKLAAPVETIRNIFAQPVSGGKALDSYIELANQKALANEVESALATAKKANDIEKAAELARELNRVTDRIDNLTRTVEATYAGRVVAGAINTEVPRVIEYSRITPEGTLRSIDTGKRTDKDTVYYETGISGVPTRTIRTTEAIKEEPRKRIEGKPEEETVKAEREEIIAPETEARAEVEAERIEPTRATVTTVRPSQTLKMRTAQAPERVTIPTETRVPPRPPEPPTRIVPPPEITKLSRKEEAKKQGIKEEYLGAVAHRQGQRRGKDVFHILKYPYQKSPRDTETVVGKTPPGVIVATGKGSAKKTARLIYGNRAPKNVNADMGAMDINYNTVGKNVVLKFNPDREGLTKHPLYFGVPKPHRTKKTRIPKASIKQGKQYFTKVGNQIAVSRRPIGRRGKRR